MVLDASSLQAPGAGQPGSRAGPDAEAGWRSMRAAVAAYAPGVTALRLARFDLHSRATARKQAELLALLAPRVQRVELRGCAIDAPLLTLLASWPAQQRVAIAGSCNWAKVAAAGTLQQMHGKISSLETAAADVAAVLPQLPALSRLAVDCQEAHLGGPPLLDVAGVLPELTALECVSLHGAATWAAEQHEFEGLVGALCELPRLQECSLSPLNGAALPASLAQLAGALTRLHLDCSGHAYTAADAERLRPGYAALWRLRACQELTLEDARAFMWPPAPAAVDLPVLRTLRLRRGDMPRDLLPPALFDAAALPALERLAVDMELSWQEAEEEEIGPAVGLPPCFASLTTLAHLELASCGLDEVPAEKARPVAAFSCAASRAMASREFDIVIFGASGFTGRHVAAEVVASGFTGKWALAGRGRAKLEGVAAALPERRAGVSAPGLVVADVADPESLAAMARSARVLINTVGPFRYWGEPVVKACVDAGTDYLDICGEPEFIEKVELQYSEAAAAAGCYVASAVGFDSVPGDLGIEYTLSLFKPPARCTLVESALTISGGAQGFRGHYPTYESAVAGFASAGELRKLRKEAEQKKGRVDLKVPGPKPPRQAGAAWDGRLNAWTFPFMGADASVIRRSMAARVKAGEPAANVAVVFTLPSRYYMTLWQGFGAAFSFLAGKPWGRRVLLQYPRMFSYGMFSHEGPSEQQMAETTFRFTNIAKGYSAGAPQSPGEEPDVEIITRISGPEPGYIACSIFIVQAAVTLLEERDKLPAPGVHTPASLLRRTTYIERLQRRGVKFEQLESAAVQ
ncbi:saccharopine dehydrogenase-like oxidoreductase [Micractinium conductrix]|uniref:Saccharopine dehydrogenase-like oxidoreductase n=1 Tax=Micractinium conductrix TaxID=554055 RepID=A0A2P6V9L1_9CHLO|nr:saccharopine dehydrogenase-like oxidoreductase [Micractinium conductrix]|eukprot:PSC70768.1 saccharopine dehydrogenase-like oxidoreductase [Micractinium conductrix]